jgi:hypothetical protein
VGKEDVGRDAILNGGQDRCHTEGMKAEFSKVAEETVWLSGGRML